jgi:Rrf2 family transcriptional regulator, nitric oxide-sensitive transcriptional repressor
MFSQTAEYALRAIVVLANNTEKPWTAQDIAAESKVPQDYLMKVLQLLVKAGLVAAQRGRGGGFILTLPPEEINVLDVITAVDPLRRIKRCPLGLKAHGTTLCPLHRKLDDAIRSVEEAFASTTIGQLLADPSPVRPLREGRALCHVQTAQ